MLGHCSTVTGNDINLPACCPSGKQRADVDLVIQGATDTCRNKKWALGLLGTISPLNLIISFLLICFTARRKTSWNLTKCLVLVYLGIQWDHWQSYWKCRCLHLTARIPITYYRCNRTRAVLIAVVLENDCSSSSICITRNYYGRKALPPH